MFRHLLHRLAGLFSSGRKRQRPASDFDAFPVCEPDAGLAPKLPPSGEPDLDATRLIPETPPREAAEPSEASFDGLHRNTQRLPWPARDAAAGQRHSPPPGGHRRSPSSSAAEDDRTMLIGRPPDRPDHGGRTGEASAEADRGGEVASPSTNLDGRPTNPDATILIPSRKRPPK